jgi:hypothetical protein
MNRLFLLVILLVSVSVSVNAQRFRAAVMGGMNLTQVDGDEVIGFKKVGGHIGAAAILPIKNWDITLEAVFNQKGAREKQQYLDTIGGIVYTGAYKVGLNYVEVPVLAHYTDKQRYTAGLGFSYGRLVSFSEEEHGGSVAPYSDTVAFNKNDYNILVDLQVRIWKQLKFNVRYAYSIVPIRERTYTDIFGDDEPWTRKQYNNLLTFRLVYVFNEPLPERKESLPRQ